MADEENKPGWFRQYLWPVVQKGIDWLGNWLGFKTSENASEEAATTAFERQQELNQQERDWESPAAQMQRFVDAGLNPNLIYSQLGGGVSPGSAPMASISPMSPTGSLDPMNVANYELIQAQIDRIKTQNANDTKMTDAEITRFAAQNNLSEKQSFLCEQEAEVAIQKAQEIQTALPNIKKQFDILDEKQKQLHFENAFTAATQDMKIAAKNQEFFSIQCTAVALAQANVLNIKADTALKWAYNANIKADTKLKFSQFKLNKAQMNLAKAQANYYVSLTNKTNAEKQSVMQDIAKQNTLMRFISHEPGENFIQSIQSTFGSYTYGLLQLFKDSGPLLQSASFLVK